jgi:hypothetical protein
MVNVGNNKPDSQRKNDENFDFILWKSELNNELLSFWKTFDDEEY